MVEKREKLKRQMYNTATDHVRKFNESIEIADHVKTETGCKSNGISPRKRCNSISVDIKKLDGSMKDFAKNRTKSTESGCVVKRNGIISIGPDNVKRIRRPNIHYSP